MLSWIWSQDKQRKTNPTSHIENVSKDIVRLWVLSYLDGPAACAFLQTCKRFTFKELFGDKPGLLWEIRTRLPYKQITYQRMRFKEISCQCGATGPEKRLRPWNHFKVGEMKCEKCKAWIPSGNTTMCRILFKSSTRCIHCNFICGYCDGTILTCYHCDLDFTSRSRLEGHIHKKHPSVVQRLIVWWNRPAPEPKLEPLVYPKRQKRRYERLDIQYAVCCDKNGYYYK